ncbi:MAG: DUF1589 domain-containing protein [Rhodopirellula sp. JB055]
MLWNKARRPTTPASPNAVRPITQPGTTWPTPQDSFSHNPKRQRGTTPT